jgi:DNA mismatch repair protein MutS
MDANLVRSHENNYLAAVARSGARRRGLRRYSTGEFRVTELEPREVPGALEQLGAREVLFPGDLPLLSGDEPAARRASCAPNSKSGSSAQTTPTAPCASISSCSRSMARASPTGRPPSAPPAPFCTTCATRSAPRSIIWIRPTYFDRAESMMLDAVTVRNLELTEPLFAADATGPQQQATVLACSIRPLTGMGGRLLRQRLLRPSLDRAEIEERLDAVEKSAAADHPARRIAQATGRHSRSGAAAGQGDARVGRSARSAGAGPLAREDSRAEALLRYPTGGAPALDCTTAR